MRNIQALIRELAEAVRDARASPDQENLEIRIGLNAANDLLIHLMAAQGKEPTGKGDTWDEVFRSAGESSRRAAEEHARQQNRQKYDDFANRYTQGKGQEDADKWWREHSSEFFKEFYSSDFAGFGSAFNRSGRSQGTQGQPGKQKRPWHTVLGCRETATMPERQKAYRRLAMKLHPDRGGKTEDFQELESAKREAGL